MKNLILLFVSTLVLFSCNNDNDNEEIDPTDKFIGTWSIFESYEDGVKETITACEQDNHDFVVKKDGTFTEYFYHLDANDACVPLRTDDGTWSKTNGDYFLKWPDKSFTGVITFDGYNKFYVEYATGGKSYKLIFNRDL